MSLSTKPLSGMRQRFPEEFRTEEYVTGILRKVTASAGFLQYDGPVIEPLSLFEAKTGGELVQRQSYSFRDRSDRDVILRPEMTPTLARMVASRGELQLPVRWFSIPLCYRYERPQRGRVREFLQFNCDVLGSTSLAAELEVVTVLRDIMETCGASPEIYRIGWSSRSFMADALRRCRVPSGKVQDVFGAIDRRDKMEPEPFSEYLLQCCGGEIEISRQVNRLISVNSPDDPWLIELMNGSDALGEILEFSSLLRSAGIAAASFSPGVIRGLDYYTGIVFELMDTGGENRRAICGGGRYDDLVGLFGSKRIPGVGFGLGVLTLTLFLETYDLIPGEVQDSPDADLYLAVFSEEVLGKASAMASFFRSRGIRTMMDVSGRKLSRQFSELARTGIPRSITVGPDEVAAGRYNLKDSSGAALLQGSPEEIAEFLSGE